MPPKRKIKREINQLQILGVFIFFLLIRLFLLFFYEHATTKYIDVMAVFVCFNIMRLKANGTTSLFWAFIAGITEDIFSGGVLGVNALSKVLVAEFFNMLGRKVEIANIALQIPSAIFLFALDTAIKYGAISVFMGLNISEQMFISTAIIKVAVNTIVFLVSYAVLR
ncbi:rod shape-determining protein MreD [Thermosulfidibacter takaii ABI70S6]|uniref:Rod shape-determining protein MreD n=1 Tax=Thermosulfidibacter takaii (strain DSM 17441 / JCM 13301 / NBRC 103674 / ABI70S6) TaxID=1298851 RepID=A0A0S3QTS5_THET7|nr:rod shape-determining protein MreD [Thermosulfidibacter takaii]BAT71744.1 rod shape-determining protein MreD [Thermosulfidibacter takaii ABI70S6]